MLFIGDVALGSQKFTSSTRRSMARVTKKSNHARSVFAMNGSRVG
jgi:hypothetical protein